MSFKNPNISILVIDYGSYVSFAQRLIDFFGTVYYFNTNVHDGFQEVRDVKVAENVPGIIKVKEWASIIDEVQYVAFSDCYEPQLQEYFRNIGKYVFGSGFSSKLETDRVFLKETIQSVGLPNGKYEVATGIDHLEYILKEKSDVYIKSLYRGDHETTKWKNYKLSKGEIRRMRKQMGTFGSNHLYVVEDKIESICEPGIDTFCVNGEYPYTICTGIETKDCSYIGAFMQYSELPKQMRDVTDKLSPIFRELGYQGMHSNEIIIGKDREGYLIDCTQRIPNPPGDVLMRAIKNFGDCVKDVAVGSVPNVEYEYKYICQLILKSEIALIDDTPILVPDQYKNNVSVKNLYIDNEGTYYYTRRGVPMKEVGSVFGWGNSLKDAIEMATDISKSIDAEDAHVDLDSVNDGLDSLKKLAKAGIKYFMP